MERNSEVGAYDRYRKRSEIPADELAELDRQLLEEFYSHARELRKERKRLPAYWLMRDLKNADGRVEWLAPKRVRKLLAYALKKNDRPTIRFIEAIIEDHPNFADEVKLKAFQSDIRDGPVEQNGLRWKGKQFTSLTETQFRLLKFHWDGSGWRTRYLNDEGYGRDVFGDSAVDVTRQRVESHQKAINRAFLASEMLLFMRVHSDRSYVQEIDHAEYKKAVKRRKKS
jgi:hypothetical protein